MKEFKDTIQKYLQERAAEDPLFAPKFANSKKNVDECCRYILGEARKRGTAVAMSDVEVFGMAVHYYDEEKTFLQVVLFPLPPARWNLRRRKRMLPVKRLSNGWPKSNTDRSKRSRQRKKQIQMSNK